MSSETVGDRSSDMMTPSTLLLSAPSPCVPETGVPRDALGADSAATGR
jgi:hypothetical protein